MVMHLTFLALWAALGLFLGMLLFLEAGRRIGNAVSARDREGAQKGGGAVEGAVFALLGLLIAFTFSGAASRFDVRRQLIAEETNAIGTAYLRVDLLPAANQAEIRTLFRRYIDARLEVYRDLRDLATTQAKLNAATALQGEIWTKALAASRQPEAPSFAAMLLLPALNQMIDITTTRLVATQTHPPAVIFFLLGLLSLIGSLLAGYGMSGTKERKWLHSVVFAAMMSLTVYVILDLEYPRLGLIRIDGADAVLQDLRNSIR